MNANQDHINIHVFRALSDDPQSKWMMNIKFDGATLHHERCQRDYPTPGDAITSTRHAVNQAIKERP